MRREPSCRKRISTDGCDLHPVKRAYPVDSKCSMSHGASAEKCGEEKKCSTFHGREFYSHQCYYPKASFSLSYQIL